MSHTYEIDTDRKLIFVTYAGRVSGDECVDLINQVLADPKYQPRMNSVSYFTDATLTWSLAELDRFRVFVSKIKLMTGPSRWAAVFPKGKDTSTARMFIALHNAFEDTIKVKLFDNEEDALSWAMEPSKVNSTST